MFKSVPIATKLPAVVLTLYLLSAGPIAFFTYLDVTKTNTQDAILKLEAMEELIDQQFELLETRYESDIASLSKNLSVIEAMDTFSMVFTALKSEVGDPASYLKSAYIDANPNPA